jgi:hypothetical protein
MTYWRMRIRDGKGGQDLWPICQEHEVAAITYDGIRDIDLRPYSENLHPPSWNQINGSAAKTSLSRFAWQIRGGDTIFVASHGEIVGMGHPSANSGELGYRFDPNSPIAPNDGVPWHNLIDMDWETSFNSFKPASMRAPLLHSCRPAPDPPRAFCTIESIQDLVERCAWNPSNSREEAD